jgi:hypothetical protein
VTHEDRKPDRAPTHGRTNGPSIISGSFEARFGDEDAARSAARDARCVGFVVTVHERDARGWLMTSRPRQPFPPDDRDRYASRLRAIATVHGGDYAGFLDD